MAKSLEIVVDKEKDIVLFIGQTFLIILGIAIGVSVQIFIGCLIQGLQKSLVEKTIGNSPQITITSQTGDKRISNYEQLIGEIKSAVDPLLP